MSQTAEKPQRRVCFACGRCYPEEWMRAWGLSRSGENFTRVVRWLCKTCDDVGVRIVRSPRKGVRP